MTIYLDRNKMQPIQIATDRIQRTVERKNIDTVFSVYMCRTTLRTKIVSASFHQIILRKQLMTKAINGR